MKCPYCGHPDTRVIDSRPAEDNNAIRRRRSCDECGKRFTTYEKCKGKRKAETSMKCPYCGHPDTRVIDSRPAEDNNAIRRRRSCDECGKRFTTYEKVETIPLIVIKKDNNREQYDRSKIEAGVLRACYKRPVSAQQIQQTIDDIELQIFKREDKEIPSKLIGEIVMDRLKDLDPVAYVR